MSDDEIVVTASAPDKTADPSPESRPKYKSWRKKFRKMKIRFDDTMKINSTMFKEEQKLEALAKRLQEENEYVLSRMIVSRRS